MVAFSEYILKAGVAWPLHPFFVKVLNYFGIAPLQLLPNEWNILTCFFIAFKKVTSGAPTTREVHYVYNFLQNSSFRDFYYIHKKVPIDLTVVRSVFNTRKAWKQDFFYVPSQVGVTEVFWMPAARDSPSLTKEEYSSRLLNLFKVDYESKLYHHILTLPSLIDCGLVSTKDKLKAKKLYAIPLPPKDREESECGEGKAEVLFEESECGHQHPLIKCENTPPTITHSQKGLLRPRLSPDKIKGEGGRMDGFSERP
ncbi:uncharacterized protein LOC115703180 [Cannabis sativa]|uniref:uncharacterized protein LOC115703180 n=1 Tax=Cannabis sativa TaxID=3483 RepID=UPI0029CA74BC|nr:uncharacterized protein LOC115703180 [Cannabis sativa]